MSPGGASSSVLGSPAGPSKAWLVPGALERRQKHLGVIRTGKKKCLHPIKMPPPTPTPHGCFGVAGGVLSLGRGGCAGCFALGGMTQEQCLAASGLLLCAVAFGHTVLGVSLSGCPSHGRVGDGHPTCKETPQGEQPGPGALGHQGWGLPAG